jgi:RNA polymerase sigma-70 factor (ECF subfamily)
MMDRPIESRFPLLAGKTGEASASSLEAEVIGLFDELRGPVLRYLRGCGLLIQDAEEVLQEVFLALFQHLRNGKSRAHLRGWVFRVAHNLALKRLNSQRRQMESDEVVIDHAPNPEDQMASGQKQERLLAAVRALPELDRRCLFLRSEGLRYREICEVLNMSIGAVSISLTRSLARIARATER